MCLGPMGESNSDGRQREGYTPLLLVGGRDHG